MPSTHKFVNDWSAEKFSSWAQSVGPQCTEVITTILSKKHHPEQSYKSCLGILSMVKKVGKSRLENACSRELQFNACSYTTVKNILSQGLDKEQELPVPEETIHLFANPIFTGAIPIGRYQQVPMRMTASGSSLQSTHLNTWDGMNLRQPLRIRTPTRNHSPDCLSANMSRVPAITKPLSCSIRQPGI